MEISVVQSSEFVSRGISFRRRDQNDLPALAILSSQHLCIFAHHRLVVLSFNTMSSIQSDEHYDDDDDYIPCDMGIKWGRPRYFAPRMSKMEASVLFCNMNKFWCEHGLDRWYPDDKPFEGEIMRSDSAQPGSNKKILQMKSFTDDEGNPKGIPGYRGLHAILDEISDEKTKVLLSLNHASPCAILKTRVCLLVAESLESSPVPASLEHSITSCVLQMATNYAEDQNKRVLKRKMAAVDAVDGNVNGNNVETNIVALSFGSTELKITMSDTEACVFFVDWQRFLYKWLFGNFDLNGNRFDGAIMKDKLVFLQLETFTGVNGRPKRIPGFQGLYAILDDLSKDGIAAQLASEECLEGIEYMRKALWLAEMMQTSPLPTDQQTISRVKKTLLLFDETFDWETYFWADFICHQMVLKALGSQYKLPSDVLVYIGNFLLPDKLKSAIAHCIFQIAADAQQGKGMDGWYHRYDDDNYADDNSYDGYDSFDAYNDSTVDQDDTDDHVLGIRTLDILYAAPRL